MDAVSPVSPVGRHMILEVWGPINALPFWSVDQASEALTKAAQQAGANVITERWHHFGSGFGYTGVIVLAESHISVHTWPEKGYAAVDVFMCGDCDPRSTLGAILEFYKATDHQVVHFTRGTGQISFEA